MNRLSYLPGAALAALVGLVVAGCSNDNNPPNDMSAVTGHVDGGPGNGSPGGPAPAAISAATVTLVRLDSQGAEQVVSNASVTTDAAGKYTVQTDADDEANLVVVAQKDAVRLRAVAAATVMHGTRVTAPPLTDETSAETAVWSRVTAAGNTPTVPFADVATLVTTELAGEITGHPGADSDVADAIHAEAVTRTAAATSASFGVTAAQLVAITRSREEARATLDEALDAAGSSQSAIDAAWDDYFASDGDAWTAANVTLDSAARIHEVGMRAFVNSLATANAGLEFAAIRAAALARARIMTQAAAKAFVDAGASAANRTTMTTAGLTLLASLRSALNAGAVSAAFDTYHNVAVATLQNTIPGRATAIAAADLAINGPVGPRETLRIGVSNTTSTALLVQAYNTFFGDARTMLMTALSGATQAEIDVASRILLDTSMAM